MAKTKAKKNNSNRDALAATRENAREEAAPVAVAAPPGPAQPPKRESIPIKKPPVLFEQTQRVVTRLEKALGQTFLAYWNSTSGSICQNDVVALNEILRRVGPRDRAMLFIKSAGGTGMAALRLVHLLRHHIRHLTAVVPLNCGSAATMLALGADEILMGPQAYLTAVDTSITHDLSPLDKDNDRVSVSQDELSRVIRSWLKVARARDSNPYLALFQHVHPLVIGAVDRASSLSIKLCEEILSYHMRDRRKLRAISRQLNAEYPSHSYPITLREARRLGLKVRELGGDAHELLVELSGLYSEMGQQAVTDFDERNYHNNEILGIHECRGVQVFYQVDKDWFYRQEERRWMWMNDQSSWHKMERTGRKLKETILHIR
jgi:hypothetical protein